MCFLGIGHGCPISDALDSIQNAGNWLYDHPLATAGIAVGGVALDAAALVCAAGPCELAGAVAGAAALVDAEATGVAADVAATGAEGLADAGVEGAADTVEGVGAPTFEDASAEDYTYTINTTYDEDSGTYALSWSGQEASSTQAEIGVADDNWYNATVDMADWTDPVRLPIPAGVKGIGAAVAVWALGADLYDELKNH
jgi:hypothetical protein